MKNISTSFDKATAHNLTLWLASPTQWTWLWASFGRWRRMGKPGVLQSKESQRVRYDWATEQIILGFPCGSDGKKLASMQETWVWSQAQEDPLEKRMSIHSNILAWRIPRTEELGGLLSMGLQRVGHDWVTNTHILLLLLNCRHPEPSVETFFS